MTNTELTAILLFSRSAAQESALKRLHPHARLNLKLHKSLVSKVLGQVKGMDLPVIVESGNQYRTFGLNLVDAIDSVFAQGYQRVIIVGSDCPDVNGSDLQQALNLLGQGKSAIGPDSHGGVYLIALSRGQYDRSAFLNLPWQTTCLGDRLHNLLCQYASVELLPKRTDLNTSTDFSKLLPYSSCLMAIWQLIQNETGNSFFMVNNMFPLADLAVVLRRGPPNY